MDLILGLNGFIWVSMHIPALEEDTEAATESKTVGAGGFDGEGVYSGKNDVSIASTARPLSWTEHGLNCLGSSTPLLALCR